MKMSTITRFGVLVAALAAISGAASSVAAASPEWLTYKHEEILPSAKVYTSPVENAVFRAMSPGGSVAFTIDCSMKTEGTVGPIAKGKIEHVTDSKGYSPMQCQEEPGGGIEGCDPPQTVEAVNLPWTTELVASGSEVHNLIKSGTNGTPGWKITCKYAVTGTLIENCPFEGYSLFTGNGSVGAELLYEPPFAGGKSCESNNSYWEGNELRFTHLEVFPGYKVS